MGTQTGGDTEAAEPSFKRLVRVSPTQQIREQLLHAIHSGIYKPGDLLPSERALCETFEVSRVSVREAIAGLEAMGMVRVEHGRGCFVTETTNARFTGPFGSSLKMHHDQMIELLKVRGALEELAAHEAALQSDPTVVSRLETLHASADQLISSPDIDLSKVVDLDVKFHATIAEGSGSELLGDLLGELNTHIADSRRLTFLSDGQPERSQREHAAILDAIRRGDAEDAKDKAGRHLAAVREWLEVH